MNHTKVRNEERRNHHHHHHHGQEQRHQHQQQKQHPHEHHSWIPNVVAAALVLLVLSGSAVAINLVLHRSALEQVRNDAMAVAEDTGRIFAKELDLAILPLFSLAMFSTEFEMFSRLHDQIGPANGPQSLPFLNATSYNRNITGVCDNPDVTDRFGDIAAQIISNANMDGVLHNIQLAPYGVICLIHPLINTPPNGNFNNTSVRGLDLLNDPSQRYLARQTLTADPAKVTIVGPRVLHQCPDCGLYFIVRLPIVSDEHTVVIDGVTYHRWGFATALIQWEELVKRLEVYKQFLQSNFEFHLTRTDYNFNQTTGLYESQIVTLARSDGFGAKCNKTHQNNCGTVSTALQTTNNEWIITVRYENHRPFANLIWLLSVVVPCCIGYLVYTILQQRQRHSYMVANTQAQYAMIEMERDMTAYFAHELRNPLSAIDSALVSMETESLIIVDTTDPSHPVQLLPPPSPNDHEVPNNNNNNNNTTSVSSSSYSRRSSNSTNGAVVIMEQRELVDSMRICTLFMKNLLNNLLDARQLEEGKMTLKIESFSLTELLHSVVTMARPSVKPGVVLKAEVNNVVNDHHHVQHPSLSNSDKTSTADNKLLLLSHTNGHSSCSSCDMVMGDRHRLQQILTNIVSNAVKYTSRGSITLSVTTPTGIGSSRSTSTSSRSWVRFECCDTGIGIPTTEHSKLFQRFALRGGAPGTGLGLNIAQNLVKLMDGTIAVESDPTIAPGTTFVIELPLPRCFPPRHESLRSNSTSVSTELLETVSWSPHRFRGEGDGDCDGGNCDGNCNDGNKTTCYASATDSGGDGRNSAAALVAPRAVTKPATTPDGDHLDQPLRILLVDDMKINRSLLKRRLMHAIAPNSTVLEASTGEECLSMIEENTDEADPGDFDVIVMDQFMTDAGGVLLGTDTILALRYRLKQTRPVIIGCSGNDLYERFVQAGADLVWQKPLPSNGTILAQLRTQLAIKQQQGMVKSEPLRRNQVFVPEGSFQSGHAPAPFAI
jgi:signal transduction histidine kinase